MSDGNLVRTALYENHLQAGANIVDFHGFELPIWYSSIQEEHTSCRSESGLFDVSHMGQILIDGEDSFNFIQFMTVNDVSKINNFEAQYSAMCNLDAGIIDDLIVFKLCGCLE